MPNFKRHPMQCNATQKSPKSVQSSTRITSGPLLARLPGTFLALPLNFSLLFRTRRGRRRQSKPLQYLHQLILLLLSILLLLNIKHLKLPTPSTPNNIPNPQPPFLNRPRHNLTRPS